LCTRSLCQAADCRPRGLIEAGQSAPDCLRCTAPICLSTDYLFHVTVGDNLNQISHPLGDKATCHVPDKNQASVALGHAADARFGARVPYALHWSRAPVLPWPFPSPPRLPGAIRSSSFTIRKRGSFFSATLPGSVDCGVLGGSRSMLKLLERIGTWNKLQTR